jgi:hypothetical protein
MACLDCGNCEAKSAAREFLIAREENGGSTCNISAGLAPGTVFAGAIGSQTESMPVSQIYPDLVRDMELTRREGDHVRGSRRLKDRRYIRQSYAR